MWTTFSGILPEMTTSFNPQVFQKYSICWVFQAFFSWSQVYHVFSHSMSLDWPLDGPSGVGAVIRAVRAVRRAVRWVVRRERNKWHIKSFCKIWQIILILIKIKIMQRTKYFSFNQNAKLCSFFLAKTLLSDYLFWVLWVFVSFAWNKFFWATFFEQIYFSGWIYFFESF